MFDALKYVTTPLTLVAFLSIILFYYLRDRNKKQVDLLKEGDPGRKNEALQILLDRYQIDSSNLTPQQKYNLIMEQVRRRDSKFKWAIFASIVLGIFGAIVFFMVNATNKLSDLGKNAENIVQPGEVKPKVDNTRTEVVTPVKSNTLPQDDNTEPASNTGQEKTGGSNSAALTLHENSSQGFSVKYNTSNWNVEDNAAAGYGQPSTGFSHRQYPNDLAVLLTINPWNNLDFDAFNQTMSGMMTQAGMKITDVNRTGQYISASGYNTLYSKMNIGRIYYSPGRSLAVDIIYTQSMENSAALKEAVAMMKSAKFD